MAAANVAVVARKRLRCYTRALKNARYLRRAEPAAFQGANGAVGFGTGVPLAVLQQVHRLRHDSPELADHKAVSRFLKRRTIRPATKMQALPLFNGTIYFAHVTFVTPRATVSFSTDDMRTMVRYAKHAIVPLSKMVRAYGSSKVSISPKLLRYTARLPARKFSDLELQGWIREIAKTHRLPEDSCVFVPCPRGVSEHDISANSGYHGFSRARKLPYIVLGVHGENLRLSDHADIYAMGISHEIAEMIVDPRANDANPEVCDPCCSNCCIKFYRAYFTISNAYLGTNCRATPGGYPFAYYTAVVVRPSGVATAKAECVAKKFDCHYRPK